MKAGAKKLRLSRETMMDLAAKDLSQAKGGIDQSAIDISVCLCGSAACTVFH